MPRFSSPARFGHAPRFALVERPNSRPTHQHTGRQQPRVKPIPARGDRLGSSTHTVPQHPSHPVVVVVVAVVPFRPVPLRTVSSRFRHIPERRSTRQIWMLARSPPLPLHHRPPRASSSPSLLSRRSPSSPYRPIRFSLSADLLLSPFLLLSFPFSRLSPFALSPPVPLSPYSSSLSLRLSTYAAPFRCLPHLSLLLSLDHSVPLFLPLPSRYTSSASPFLPCVCSFPLRPGLVPACQYVSLPAA